MRKIVSKAMRVGRATVFAVGLAVILAAVFGVASEAVAAKKVPSLKRGVVNAVSTVTTLAGTLADPILRLDNNGEGPALDLQVEPDGAPLTANPEAGTATGLSADELDGKSSEEFLAADGKAADSDLLDGQDSADFASASAVRPPRSVTLEPSGVNQVVSRTLLDTGIFEVVATCEIRKQLSSDPPRTVAWLYAKTTASDTRLVWDPYGEGQGETQAAGTRSLAPGQQAPFAGKSDAAAFEPSNVGQFQLFEPAGAALHGQYTIQASPNVCRFAASALE